MKKLMCLLTALTLAMSIPLSVGATGQYPQIDDYKLTFEYNDIYQYRLFTWGGLIEMQGYKNVGDRVSLGANFTDGFFLALIFDIDSYLDKYLFLINNSTNAWLQITLDIDMSMLPAGSGNGNTVELDLYRNGVKTITNTTQFDGGIVSGYNAFSPCEITDLKNLKESDYVETALLFNSYTGGGLMYRSCNYVLRSYTITIYLQGIDGQDADQFIVISNDIKNVETAVNNVRDEVKKMQGQLDNIDNSINQGFGQMGDKLDSVQGSINQGFDGVLNPDKGDIDRNDQISDDLADNKNEVNNIIDAMGSVDKPNVDDAFGLVDPEQIVDLEDDSVQEMAGIIASVTGNSVIKNYLMLLFGIALVSFIFFGKKGG